MTEYHQTYYQANKDKYAEYHKINKEKIAEQKAAYRKANKSKIAEYKAEYYAEYHQSPQGRAHYLLNNYKRRDKKK